MMYPRTAVAILALTGLATSSIGSANAFVAPAHSVPSVAASSSSSTSALFVAFGSSGGSSSSSASDDGETFASALARGWRPERGSFAGLRRKDRATGTILPMYEDDTGAIMPDGGLSPCVIKVIGVGGGGCNAVSGLLAVWCACTCMCCWIVVGLGEVFARTCKIADCVVEGDQCEGYRQSYAQSKSAIAPESLVNVIFWHYVH